jgi:hypothetical protein
MRNAFIISLLLLSACSNLSASLLEGNNRTYTSTYEADGLQHSLTITFVVEGRSVIGMDIDPGAGSGTERGRQLAFSANVRRYVLDRTPEEVELALPESVGEEAQLTEVFRDVIEDLKADL